MRPLITILIVALAAGTAGCGEKTAGGDKAAGSASASGSRDASPGMAKFRIGPAAATDGVVTIEADSFHQGDPIHISYEVKNVPSKSQARVVWSDSSKKKISEEQKPLTSGTGAVSFEMKGAKDLPAGDYVVEFYYGDPEAAGGKWSFMGSKTFKVGVKQSSRETPTRSDIRI